MTVDEVREQYENTQGQVDGLADEDTFRPEGRPVNAKAIRQYLAALEVLFDEIVTANAFIAKITQSNVELVNLRDRLDESLREANDEIVARGLTIDNLRSERAQIQEISRGLAARIESLMVELADAKSR